MGAFFSRQPNGRICRFSTVVDTITDYNLTDEEYVFMYSTFGLTFDEGMQEFEKRARPFEMVSERFVPNNMTQEEFDEIMEKMKAPVEDPKRIIRSKREKKCSWCSTFGQVPLRGFTIHGCESITVKYCPLCGRCLDPEITKKQEEDEDKILRSMVSQADVVLRAANVLRDAKSKVFGEHSDEVNDLDLQILKLERMRDKWNQEAARLVQMKL